MDVERDGHKTTRARVMRRSTGVPWCVGAASVVTIPAAPSPTIDSACNRRIILLARSCFGVAADTCVAVDTGDVR